MKTFKSLHFKSSMFRHPWLDCASYVWLLSRNMKPSTPGNKPQHNHLASPLPGIFKFTSLSLFFNIPEFSFRRHSFTYSAPPFVQKLTSLSHWCSPLHWTFFEHITYSLRGYFLHFVFAISFTAYTCFSAFNTSTCSPTGWCNARLVVHISLTLNSPCHQSDC